MRPKGPKFFFLEAGPPPYLRVWMTRPPPPYLKVWIRHRTHYFRLPYVGRYSSEAQERLCKLLKRFCNNVEIKLAFCSFKVHHMFSIWDPVPYSFDLHSGIVYKFHHAGCDACYNGETCGHLSTCVHEHLTRDRTSNILMQFQQSDECPKLCSKKCFLILDSTQNQNQL